MAISLKEQLLKAGLVDKKKIKQVETEQRKQQKKKNKATKAERSSFGQQAERQQKIVEQKEQKRLHDRALNQERDKARYEKEIIAQCRQMIIQQQITMPDDGEIAYNYVYNKKIKTLYLNTATQQQLIYGQLAIAMLEDKAYLIPDKFAAKIEQRQPDFVIRSQPEETTEDDPYADYEIPDDLMW